jgi:hypothetical protein
MLGVTEYAAAKLPAEVTCPKHPRNLVTTAIHQDLLYKTPDLIGAQWQLRPNKVGSCQGWKRESTYFLIQILLRSFCTASYAARVENGLPVQNGSRKVGCSEESPPFRQESVIAHPVS